MSIEFNVDEVLAVAEQIERNGDRFYRLAAERQLNSQAARILVGLADMEQGHLKTFSEMRASLSEAERKPVTFDPYDESALYLNAMADRNVFDVTRDPTEKLAGADVSEVLRLGIEVEKDSIVFYVGLKELVPERLGRERIDAITKEELNHFAKLSEMLADLD